jgi:hypothetical protein
MRFGGANQASATMESDLNRMLKISAMLNLFSNTIVAIKDSNLTNKTNVLSLNYLSVTVLHGYNQLYIRQTEERTGTSMILNIRLRMVCKETSPVDQMIMELMLLPATLRILEKGTASLDSLLKLILTRITSQECNSTTLLDLCKANVKQKLRQEVATEELEDL